MRGMVESDKEGLLKKLAELRSAGTISEEELSKEEGDPRKNITNIIFVSYQRQRR